MRRTWGRCPHCGESVIVEVTEREPGKIVEHSCEARSCEYAGCLVTELKEEMVQLAGGEWHCPSHGLLLAARHLVALYRAESDAEWTAISEIIGETLPDIVVKVETQEGRAIGRTNAAPSVPSPRDPGGRDAVSPANPGPAPGNGGMVGGKASVARPESPVVARHPAPVSGARSRSGSGA